MVILTITCDQKLRAQLPSWLLVSLAGADLLVGLLVMPLTMIYEIVGVWTFGKLNVNASMTELAGFRRPGRIEMQGGSE